jgi:uncharacterized protein (TIGR02594 family)
MFTRRGFLRAAASTAVSTSIMSYSGYCLAQENLPHAIGIDPDFDGPLPPPGTLGRTPALRNEVRIARAILSKAPPGPSPFDVAKYFLAVAKGEFSQAWQPYAQGWPERWNPVIVTFFQATDTKPEGDVTPWCSAFVNWCFVQSGQPVGTHNASSGSFRNFGTKTANPVPGDIVVFRRTDPVEAQKGRGHVGFFVADHGSEVEVLGGNQIEGREHNHKISSKPLKKQGSILILDSFRTDPTLHQLA